MSQHEVYVVGAARTAIGTYGGTLKDKPLRDLATLTVSESLRRAKVDPAEVNHVVMGNVIPTEPCDAYLGRVAALDSGMPMETPAFNVNRLCGSGLQAIISASQSILMGDAEVAVGAGAESMSRSPYMMSTMRWGARMGNVEAIDYMNAILHDPWHSIHMGGTAENVATRYGIDRISQDKLALESHQRAARAIDNGYFADQILPVEIKHRKGISMFDQDEHVRPDTTAEKLASMRPAFNRDSGTVTAGNASGLNDGASSVVLASGAAIKRLNLQPMARLVGYTHAGVDPQYMGIGPVPAIRKLVEKTGVGLDEISVIELNEAFAAQAQAVINELSLDPAIVNPNGSGISLGHPIGATGAIITTKAIYELHRVQGRYAMVSMCIGGGQGIAALFERQ